MKINKNILAYQDDYNSAYNHDVWLEIATHPLLWQYSSFLLRILSALSNDKSAILCGHKNNDNLKQEITSNLTYPSWGWLHLNPVNKIIPTRRKCYMQIFSNILRIQFFEVSNWISEPQLMIAFRQILKGSYLMQIIYPLIHDIHN